MDNSEDLLKPIEIFWEGDRVWDLIECPGSSSCGDVRMQGLKGPAQHILAAAAIFGKLKLVQTLIEEKSVDIRGQTYFGTPFQCAARGGHCEVAQLFLAQSSITFESGFNDDRPLMAAALAGYPDMVCLPFESQYGCTEDRQPYEEAVIQAARGGHQSLIELLKARGSKYMPSYIEDSVVLEAAHYGFKRVVEKALDNGVNINFGKAPGKVAPPLWVAATRGHEQIVRLLLSRGADPYLRKRGRVLKYTAARGYKSIIKLLLEKHR